ncbi:MAG: dicarboxylate/amino acid:cation symporter, partial [Mariprofundales bacterium]|nr:dicarboxylate/amino acid:cation symporter [Mariprofundales bacterium]
MATAIVSGGVAGYFWGEQMSSIAWIGHFFLTALKMLIVPLIVASIISGVSALGDVRKLGRLGGITIGYYVTTTFVAVTIGLLMANLWQPGVGVPISSGLQAPHPKVGDIGITDLILSFVNPNIVDAAANMKLLPLIVFCLLFAAALTTLGERGRVAIDFFDALNSAMMTIVGWVMMLAPVGVFALIAANLGAAGGGEAFMAQLMGLAKYALAVISGLLLHACFLLLLLYLLAKRGVLEYLGHLATPLLTAFSTASSSATLPLTMNGVKAAGVDERARKFV